jgi:hypothetical protein
VAWIRNHPRKHEAVAAEEGVLLEIPDEVTLGGRTPVSTSLQGIPDDRMALLLQQ